jgi:hypothetical protein
MKKSLPLAFVVILCSFTSAFAQSLPNGWSTADVGNVGATGSASGSGGSFSVSGAGADIWGTADAFRYVYTTLTGDGSVVTEVTSEQYVANWTKAGVMMRETLDPSSRQAFMLVSPGKGLAFQRRVDYGGVSTNTGGAMATAPYFVKLTRSGTTITAAQSADGANWTVVGSDTIAMAPTIYVGVAVGSHVYGTLAAVTFASTAVAAAPPPAGSTETLVFFRHGEKPANGYGQLTCQGLNRANALPPVLASKYGPAQYAFAPDPTVQIPDAAGSFYYVRPLATIEPTAISLGLPVNVRYGYTDVADLQSELLSSVYANTTVFVAWEHQYLQAAVQNILDQYGAGVTVPTWASTDFDSIYVVRITNNSGTITAQFTHDYEGLNGLSSSCQ